MDTLERQLLFLEGQARAQTDDLLQENKFEMDEFDRAAEFQNLYERIEHQLPRFFRNSFLVSLWAVYESAIIEIANYLRDQKGRTLGISDIRGNFLDQAKKYFDHVLEFPLCADNQVWERLKMLNVLRNAIAHSNGRMTAIQKESRKKIEGWERSNTGILSYYGDIMVSEDFLRETYLTVNKALNDLLQRVRSTTSE